MNHKLNHSTHWIFNLIPLLLGGFSIGMTEFLVMGVLPDIAQSLAITIPTAGYLIAIYALGVVIGAPSLIAIANTLSPKKTLMLLMFLFTLFNSLFFLAPNYTLLFCSRFMAGLPHGAFFGVGAVVGTRLAPPGKEARAIAIMFTGLTIANLIGVPFGTFIGHHYSWRLAYALVSLSGLVSLIGIALWLPEVDSSTLKNNSSKTALFLKGNIWLILGISAIGTGGMFCWISYIAPLMTVEALFSSNAITLIMMIAGSGMALGNLIGGQLTDKYPPLSVITILLSLMAVCLLLVIVCIHYWLITLILTFVCGAVAFAVVPAIQMLMIDAAKGSELFASSIVQASGNMANTLGAYLGGIPILYGFSFTSPEYVGIVLALSGVFFTFILSNRKGSDFPANNIN